MIVLVQTDGARNSWPMGRMLEINKDENNVVRSVKLLTSEKGSSFTSRILEQPISKLIAVRCRKWYVISRRRFKGDISRCIGILRGARWRGNKMEKCKTFEPLMEEHCFYKRNLFVSNLVTFLSYFDEILCRHQVVDKLLLYHFL